MIKLHSIDYKKYIDSKVLYEIKVTYTIVKLGI